MNSNNSMNCDEDTVEKKSVIEGTVEHITYYNSTNGFTIFSLLSEEEEYKSLGYFPDEIKIGDNLRLHGYFRKHHRWGMQFHVTDFSLNHPVTQEGVMRFLTANVKGIGEKRAKKLISVYGVSLLDTLETNPDEVLKKIKGLTREQREGIKKTFREDIPGRRILVSLASLGIRPQMAGRLYERYGKDVYEKIKENPYVLIDEVFGIGFKRADDMALNSGVEKSSPYRISAGLNHALAAAANSEGHVYLPRAEWYERAASPDILDLPLDNVKSCYENGEITGDNFIIHNDRAYLSYYWKLEGLLAGEIKRIIDYKLDDSINIHLSSFIKSFEDKSGINLSDEQKRFMQEVITNKIIILTGGPGTGKTTLLAAVTELFERHHFNVKCCAPTGRAARRISTSTKRPASTIHRLLEFSPGGFNRNHDNPLDVDVLIVDEISMVDISLAYNLLSALLPDTRVILVGDAYQLPSIQAGNFFRDMLRFEGIPHIELDVVFRQKHTSNILSNAHRIKNGQPPFFENKPDSDFFFMETENALECEDLVVDLVYRRLPEHYHFDNIHDIQILSPMYKGVAGVNQLNNRLQDKLNPSAPEVRIQNRLYRSGDKIMQLKNNYEDMVFNGDMGILVTFGHNIEDMKKNTPDVQMKTSFLSHIHSLPEKKLSRLDNDFHLVVLFDGGRWAVYPIERSNQIRLGYASTVHKSQGSEYPAVIVTCLTQHYIMLYRNLIYTAITRAKKVCILAGTKKAAFIAVKNNREEIRYSSLLERIKE